MVAIATTRFADWLLRMMKDRNETPADVARGALIPQSSISAYLNQGALPAMETCEKIAKHFGVELSDVWAARGSREEAPPRDAVEIIPEIRYALERMTPAEQRTYALRAIRLAEELLRAARGESE